MQVGPGGERKQAGLLHILMGGAGVSIQGRVRRTLCFYMLSSLPVESTEAVFRVASKKD